MDLLGSQPTLTYYEGTDRIELSGASLANWRAKVAHLLGGHYELAAGSRLCLDLPGHWIVPVIASAAAELGIIVELPTSSLRGAQQRDPAPIDLTILSPDSTYSDWSDAAEDAICSMHVMGEPMATTPPGLDDFLAEARMQPDAYPFKNESTCVPTIATSGVHTVMRGTAAAADAIEKYALQDSRRVLLLLSGTTIDLATLTVVPNLERRSFVLVAPGPKDVAEIAAQERTDAMIDLRTSGE